MTSAQDSGGRDKGSHGDADAGPHIEAAHVCCQLVLRDLAVVCLNAHTQGHRSGWGMGGGGDVPSLARGMSSFTAHSQ